MLALLLPTCVWSQATMPDDTKQFRIGLYSSMNAFFDETMLYFESGVPTKDQFDVIKPPFSTNGAPQLATISTDDFPLMLNAYGAVTSSISIPLRVKAGVSGTHWLKFFDGPGFLEATCVRLEDTNDGSIVRIAEGDSVLFNIDANDPINPPRFNLLVGITNSWSKTNVSCFGFSDGAIAIIGGDTGPWNYEWYGPGGIHIQDQLNHAGVSKLNNAAPGIYRIEINGTNFCGVQTSYIEITQPDLIQAQMDIQPVGCNESGTGEIVLTTSGGVAPYSYYWENGSTDSVRFDLNQGMYSVNVTDNIGCMRYYQEIEVGTQQGAESEIVASTNNPMVNEPVDFHNLHTDATEYLWLFGDGTSSILPEPNHAFVEEGKYRVQLIVDPADCGDTSSTTIVVRNNGISNVGPFQEVDVAWDNGQIVVAGDDYTLERAVMTVVDMGGRLVVSGRSIQYDREINVNLSTGGIYRVVLTNPAGSRSYPISIFP